MPGPFQEEFVLSRDTADKLLQIIDSDRGARYGRPFGAGNAQIAMIVCGESAGAPTATPDDGQEGFSGTLYEGLLSRFLGENWSWQDADGPVWLTDANGTGLSEGVTYLAMRSGTYSEAPVFQCVAVPGPPGADGLPTGYPHLDCHARYEAFGGVSSGVSQIVLDVGTLAGAGLSVGAGSCSPLTVNVGLGNTLTASGAVQFKNTDVASSGLVTVGVVGLAVDIAWVLSHLSLGCGIHRDGDGAIAFNPDDVAQSPLYAISGEPACGIGLSYSCWLDVVDDALVVDPTGHIEAPLYVFDGEDGCKAVGLSYGCGLSEVGGQLVVNPADLAGNCLAVGSDCQIGLAFVACGLRATDDNKLELYLPDVIGEGLSLTSDDCPQIFIPRGCGITLDNEGRLAANSFDLAGVGLVAAGPTDCPQLNVNTAGAIAIDGSNHVVFDAAAAAGSCLIGSGHVLSVDPACLVGAISLGCGLSGSSEGVLSVDLDAIVEAPLFVDHSGSGCPRTGLSYGCGLGQSAGALLVDLPGSSAGPLLTDFDLAVSVACVNGSVVVTTTPTKTFKELSLSGCGQLFLT